MRHIELGTSGLTVPAIGIGCMRMAALDVSMAKGYIETALELGLNFFDHADIYGRGASEERFAAAAGITPSNRAQFILQSKCGIVPGCMYDFSSAHILNSVDGILKRLGTEYLDVLLLHRPDALCEPEEVAQAFEQLHTSGKVRHFGVSNHSAGQIKLLQRYLTVPLSVNQLQFSLTNATLVSSGMHCNMMHEAAIDRDGALLDYCRLEDICIQAWSPFQHGTFAGTFLNHPEYPALNAALDRIAQAHQVSSTTIALAWILRHPAQMQPIVGTMNSERLRDCAAAVHITLSRQEWYELYLAAGNDLP